MAAHRPQLGFGSLAASGLRPGGFFVPAMNRTAFLIDGFNLYHSVRAAAKLVGGRGMKWLDISRLCSSYLHVVGNGATLENVYYFSALATHLEATNLGVTKRHQTFISCLRASGVQVELARFKKKIIWCSHCHQKVVRREEKETDVAIAVKMMELLYSRSCETIVLMTGDTDIAPAVRSAQRLFPGCTIWFAFPYDRKNKELEQLTGRAFQITKESYQRHQFPDPYVLADGTSLVKPAAW